MFEKKWEKTINQSALRNLVLVTQLNNRGAPIVSFTITSKLFLIL